jgi:hypothetical protein
MKTSNFEFLDDGEEEGWEAAWDVELAKRMKDIDSGRELGEPADGVLKRLHEKHCRGDHK